MQHSRETNVDCITRLMEFSPTGALAQVFIVNAILTVAEQTATMQPEQLETGMVSGEVWIQTAQHVRDELRKHLNIKTAESAEGGL